MKKSISVVASAVLAGVLMLNGCGGSNSPKVKVEPDIGSDTAKGTAQIIADTNGKTSVKVSLITGDTQKEVAVAIITRVAGASGVAVCTTAGECEVTAKQISACGIDSSDVAFTDAKAHVSDLIADADRWDPETDMVVFGGNIEITASGFNKCDMELSINMISCGSAFKTDGTSVQAGFANENHIVDIFVEEADGTSRWIRDVKIKDGKINLPAGSLTNVDLPAKFTFYSIKTSNKEDTTGVTGGTGGSGY